MRHLHSELRACDSVLISPHRARTLCLCRYEDRTQVLTTCQEAWYGVEADTALNFDQLTAAQEALPCQLWGTNDTAFRCETPDVRVLKLQDFLETNLKFRAALENQFRTQKQKGKPMKMMLVVSQKPQGLRLYAISVMCLLP